MDALGNPYERSPNVVIRAADPKDFEIICAMNLAETQHTSTMDVARLTELSAISC